MVEVASLDKDVSILFEFSESKWNDLAPAMETIVKSSDARLYTLMQHIKTKSSQKQASLLLNIFVGLSRDGGI